MQPWAIVYIFPVSAAEQVLKEFQTPFVNTVDANAIVYKLKNKDIIDGGDLTTITRTPGAKEKNEYLHECLRNKCDEEALMEVCEVIMNVEGNRKMKSLGKKMKSALEGKLCALRKVFVHDTMVATGYHTCTTTGALREEGFSFMHMCA